MQENILETINITKRFPGVLANDNVCISLRRGEILGLIGENGAGKSTILKILNGIYSAGTYEGTLKVKGNEVKIHSPQDAIDNGIAFVPQETNVLRFFTVAENLFMSDQGLYHCDKYRAAQNGQEFDEEAERKKHKSLFIDKKRMKEAALELFEEYKINLDPEADVRKLSIGQQQMLMIARALASHPEILILDEPTTSLSDSDVKNLFEVVRHLKSKGMSTIFVTHKMAEILELTDRVTILRDGKNITTYEREDYDVNLIIQGMVGRKLDQIFPERKDIKLGDVVFEVQNLCVAHPYIADTNLIDNVSFKVRAGEVLGLAGLVGAGRSETCLAAYGLMPIKSGKVLVNGKEVKIKTPEDAVKHGIGMVSEDRKVYGLNFLWDIKKNIAISNLNQISRGMFVQPRKMSDRVKPFFERLRIKANNMSIKVATLSGGNQQKVVVARTMNTDPKVIILDEPTKGIDVGAKFDIYEIINNMAAEGAAVIVISSELDELIGMSDRFVVMAEGRVAGELSKEEGNSMSIMAHATKTFKNKA